MAACASSAPHLCGPVSRLLRNSKSDEDEKRRSALWNERTSFGARVEVRSDDGFSHAGLHLPKDGTLVREHHAKHCANRNACSDVRLRRVATDEAERKIVSTAEPGGVERDIGGPMLFQPIPEFVLVE